MSNAVSDDAQCFRCGYPLRGLPASVCPECGTEFDPNDPSTYRDPLNPGWWYRPPLPMPRWLRIATLPVTILWLVDVSSPDAPVYWAVSLPTLVLSAFLFFTAYDLVKFGLGFLKMSLACAYRQVPKYNLNTKGLTLIAACIITVLSCMIYPWPTMLRFKLTQRVLERAAIAQLADGKGTFESRRIGGYWIRGLFIPYRGTIMLQTGSDYTAQVGFVFSKSGEFPHNLSIMQPLSDNWCVALWEVE